MDFNDELRKLNDNPELAKSLEEAINRGVQAGEFQEILVEAGVDAGAAELLAAEYQRRRGLAVADEDLDEDMLRRVAGGGCGKCTNAADCDSAMKNSDYWDMERCTLQHYCDEAYYCPGQINQGQ